MLVFVVFVHVLSVLEKADRFYQCWVGLMMMMKQKERGLVLSNIMPIAEHVAFDLFVSRLPPKCIIGLIAPNKV